MIIARFLDLLFPYGFVCHVGLLSGFDPRLTKPCVFVFSVKKTDLVTGIIMANGKQDHPVGLKLFDVYIELQCHSERQQQYFFIHLNSMLFITLCIPYICFIYTISQLLV